MASARRGARRQRLRGRDRGDARRTATRSSSSRTSPRARRPARGSTTSTRARACRWSSSRGTRTRSPTSTPRSSAGRTASPRPPSPRCASAACGSSTSRPTSGCATAAIYEDWYGAHGAPELFGTRRLRAARAAPRRDRRRRPRRQPRLLPDRRAARARPARPRRPDRRRRDRREVRRLGRRAASRRAATHFISADENMTPYKVDRHRHTPEIEQELAGQGAPLTVTFTPHLVPLAQGELVSCYVDARARATPRTSSPTLYDDAYAREPWVELRAGPPGVLEVRDTNYCRISVHGDGRTGPDPRLRLDRQPVEGRRVAGRAEPQPDVRPRRARGAGVTLHLALGRAARHRHRAARGRARRGLPRGRRARRDQAVRRPRPRAARLLRARTRSAPRASPAPACSPRRCCCARSRCRLDALRAVVVNSGNANAATGNRGLEDAARMQGAGAMAAGVHEDRVAVASTGVIGVPLPMDGIPRAILAARGELAAGRRRRVLARDRHDRRVREAALARRRAARPAPCAISAQAKGAGMIQPGFATMLCFVQTDAALEPETADLLLGVCVKRSFDRISVDGQLSTNDTAILMASGRERRDRRARVRGRAAARRGARLRAAAAGAADRARRRGRGADRPRARPRRRTTRPSSASPARSRTRRWSRPRCTAATRTGAAIAQAVGAALPGAAPLPYDIWIEGVQVCAGGVAVPHDAAALAARRRRRGRVRRRAARRGRRDRGLLLRPLARVRPDQRGVHDVKHDVSDAARGAPVHPGVPRQDGGDQVRRRGDGGPGAARGLRARRRAAQVRRDEPDRRPRRRAGHHPLHGAAGHAGRVRRRPARLRRRHGRDREDGARRQGQQGHRPAARPPRPAGGRAVRRRRAAVPRRHDGGPRRARTSGSSGGSSASTPASSATSPRTTSR